MPASSVRFNRNVLKSYVLKSYVLKSYVLKSYDDSARLTNSLPGAIAPSCSGE
jgi:hypothetical protein